MSAGDTVSLAVFGLLVIISAIAALDKRDGLGFAKAVLCHVWAVVFFILTLFTIAWKP